MPKSGNSTYAFIDTGKNGSPSDDSQSPVAPETKDATGDTGNAPAGVDVDSLSEEIRQDRVVMRLLREGRVSRPRVYETLDQYKKQRNKGALWRTLARHPEVDREMIYAEAAATYAFPREEVDPDTLDTNFVRKTIDRFSRTQQDRLLAFRLLPLRREPDPQRGIEKYVFATYDPMRPDIFPLLQELELYHVELRYTPESTVAPLLDELYPRRNEFLERLQENEEAASFDLGTSYQEKSTRLVDEDQLEAEINRSSLINLFEASLVEGVRMDASDIHIYPNGERQTEFYMRIDGALRHWHTQDKVHPESMLAVVKDRCMNVDRFDREIAQDGYIQRTVDDKLIRYRVSVLPMASTNRDVKSESVVIRVLDDKRVFTDLKQLNLQQTALDRFEKAIRQPHGMVIMTGPTGSGKSTTLAAALHQVISPERNVLTVEDPVEYIIQGARQIKLGPRLELENALRSILRHDPDVVMVGEMRDRPTAELAIKLANTGHLTFSTLHTNDAPSAVSRLAKMGVEPFLIAYAINLVVAQRLLRKVCPKCKRRDDNPDRVLLEQLGFTPREIDSTTFYKEGSQRECRACGGVGYKGRQAIAEAMYFTRDIRHIIVESGETVDEDTLRDTAISDGMLTLLAVAREVLKRGDTTVEEVLRVVSTD